MVGSQMGTNDRISVGLHLAQHHHDAANEWCKQAQERILEAHLVYSIVYGVDFLS